MNNLTRPRGINETLNVTDPQLVAARQSVEAIVDEMLVTEPGAMIPIVRRFLHVSNAMLSLELEISSVQVHQAPAVLGEGFTAGN